MKSYIVTSEGVAIYMDGKSYSADKSHPRYHQIVDAIRSEAWDDIPGLVNIAIAVQNYATGSAVTVDADAGIVSYQGEPLRGYLVERILTMMNDGFNIKPMTAYLENLMQNPSKRSVDELHGFNEYGRMPITEDGYFIAYKRIKGWYDTYTGQVLNKPAHLLDNDDLARLPYTVRGVTVDLVDGALTVSMPRNRVDDVAERTCSYGLHFCSQEYLKSFGGDKIVVLKINPADVVSIPTDYNNTKGRCCKYQVIDVLSEEEFNKAMNVDVFLTSVYNTGTGWDEDDFDDDDDWFEVDDLVPGVILDAGKVVDALQTLITPVALTAVSDKSGSFVTQDFINGYLVGYRDSRSGDGTYYSNSVGDWHNGYAEGWKDGKAHKAKRFK